MTTMPAQRRRRKASQAERQRNFFLRMRDAFSADGDSDDVTEEEEEGDSAPDAAADRFSTTDIGRSTLRGVITLFVRLRPISLDRVSRTTLVRLVILDKDHSSLI